MSGPSTIDWTEATWNPVTGCRKVSPGCDRCYAETFAERFRGVPGHPYEQGFDLRLWPERLSAPLRWRRPRLVFVNSMSDLFQVGVPDDFVMDVWRVMGLARHHTFQVLTKRADRMERWLRRWADTEMGDRRRWPAVLPNVWLGVSVESPAYYGRVRHLQRTPATVRFLSCEPLLEALPDLPLEGIDWVIVGGESGHGARPMELDWVRDLVARCRAAGVAVFVKQLGTHWAGQGKGNRPEAWPEDLRVRAMPRPAAGRWALQSREVTDR